MEKHNINYELKLLELFEYSITGPDNSNRWLIFDKNNNNVGFIQFKKISNGNKGKRFAYVASIDSSDFIFEYTKEAKADGKYEDNSIYRFEIKRKNGDIDGIEIDINEPLIRLWTKEYGYLDYHISNGEFFLNYQSKTENFSIEEFVSYTLPNDVNADKKFVYQIRNCDKDKKINESNSNTTIREISGRYNKFEHKENTLELTEGFWIDNINQGSNKQIVEGKISEMIRKQEMGIDSITHFRQFIKEFLPINQSILDQMISDETFRKYGFKSLLSCGDEEQTKERTTT